MRWIDKQRARWVRRLRPDGVHVVRSVTRGTTDGGALRLDWDGEVIALLKHKQAALGRLLGDATGGVVQAGPFRGMQFVGESSWGDVASKLLGAYEHDLHRGVERLIDRRPDVVANVGCGEGYYAVGLARRLTDARVHAFDVDARARELCAELAELNGLAARLEVHAAATHEALATILEGARHGVLLIDCEGCEAGLLDPGAVSALDRCDLLVECHDFVEPEVTGLLQQRFAGTHDIQRIDESTLDPRTIPQLARLGSFEAWLALCEFRPEPMHWLLMQARSSTGSVAAPIA